MKGAYHIRVKNARNSYEFLLRRNITILAGNSGSGKTTLYEMVREYNRFGKSSGVSVSCDREIVALEENDWERILRKLKQKIIVIDEDSKFIFSEAFAKVLRKNDNYFLLITRNYLKELPYSVDEIYAIKGNKNKKFVPIYTEIEKMYDHPDESQLPFVPEIIITEDAGSGYQFFKKMADAAGIECKAAGGKSKICQMARQNSEKNLLVIADGAAFGAEIHDLAELQKKIPLKLAIYLPESFEWLLLKAGVVQNIDNGKLIQPEAYADSKEYMSWEQFFFSLIKESTKNIAYQKYSKRKLPAYYTQEAQKNKVISEMKGVSL